MNEGKGVSQAHLARKVGVSRSFVTKLEKGKAQPGAELMLRVAHYFKQTVETVFRLANGTEAKPAFIYANTIPNSQFKGFTPAPAKSLCNNRATSSARPAGMESAKDKMLVGPTATIKGK